MDVFDPDKIPIVSPILSNVPGSPVGEEGMPDGAGRDSSFTLPPPELGPDTAKLLRDLEEMTTTASIPMGNEKGWDEEAYQKYTKAQLQFNQPLGIYPWSSSVPLACQAFKKMIAQFSLLNPREIEGFLLLFIKEYLKINYTVL